MSEDGRRSVMVVEGRLYFTGGSRNVVFVKGRQDVVVDEGKQNGMLAVKRRISVVVEGR